MLPAIGLKTPALASQGKVHEAGPYVHSALIAGEATKGGSVASLIAARSWSICSDTPNACQENHKKNCGQDGGSEIKWQEGLNDRIQIAFRQFI